VFNVSFHSVHGGAMNPDGFVALDTAPVPLVPFEGFIHRDLIPTTSSPHLKDGALCHDVARCFA
jgi:hypothetical protein